ncbi:MAG: hypothetical protein ACXVX9_05675 [Mycobacteriaceae bacterium]
MNIHIGKRGLVLLMFGGIFIAYGLLLKDAPQHVSLPLLAWCPIRWQGWAWVVTGGAGMLLALTSRREWVGFIALFPMPVVWTIAFTAAFFTHAQPLNGALLWALLTGILYVVADWAEPPPEHPPLSEVATPPGGDQ